MSISIDSHNGGPIESVFGGQVEQRVGPHVDQMEDNIVLGHHGRGASESRDSTSADVRLLNSPSSQVGAAPASAPLFPKSGRTNWSRIATTWTAWCTRLLWSTTTPSLALLTTMISNKRRKSWFLSLILISLALTVFSGGYLLTQLHHQKDLAPTPPTVPIPDVMTGDVDPSAGPRKDRNRGKKNRGPKKKTPPEGAATKTKSTNGKGDGTNRGTDKNVNTDKHGSDDNRRPLDGGATKGNKTVESGRPSTTTDAPQLRICNLEDITKGHWVQSKSQVSAANLGRDLSWTGYGPYGCRSNIWNERYLLTPSRSAATTGDRPPSDLKHAQNLKQFQWQLNYQQHQQQSCRQPTMDVADFVEVLKRSPLIMIGDKFLEQEYLVLECIILGMQDQLLHDFQREQPDDETQEEAWEALEYHIESEWPPVVELKIAAGAPRISGSTSGPSRSRSNIYRKAKPGQMRLVDRISNLTLVTFIRSDVLWDSAMLTGQVAKHALKSVAELASLDAGGLHPDCKVAGTILMCEPAHIESHKDDTGSRGKDFQQSISPWWRWWEQVVNDDHPLEHDPEEDLEEELSFGSDLAYDMINLEWVQILEDFVQDSRRHREGIAQEQMESDADVERKPMILVSNGHFWEYDPQDAIDPGLRNIINNNKKLSKAEQGRILVNQNSRRKLLRQRYTMVLANMLDYIKETYPDLRVMVQTSVRRGFCGTGPLSNAEKTIRDANEQEAALLNALTKIVVAKMQDPLYAFLDTTFLQRFHDPVASKRRCSSFMIPGPLDTLVHHLYGELYRLDL
ncbi:hypothetical protein BG011_009695 [Mortierella polycephala]|uniref:Uncharacterized protein n=1 Tax=Mortierella polycephala TaxID=41804 RepID=A0A9P6TW11_9FUNG|nr:hypothetical protein BG011_009695 [Mortierella polycephala]